jgi:hypothetical protein
MGKFDSTNRAKRKSLDMDTSAKDKNKNKESDYAESLVGDDEEDGQLEQRDRDEHALTLSGYSGSRLKRELSRHQLFHGLDDTQSPETTFGGGTMNSELADVLGGGMNVLSGVGGRDDVSNNGPAAQMHQVPSLAAIFGTSSRQDGRSSPSIQQQQQQQQRQREEEEEEEKVEEKNVIVTKTISTIPKMSHANTLSGANARFLSEEIKQMSGEKKLLSKATADGQSKSRKKKSVSIREGDVAPNKSSSIFDDKPKKMVDEVLDQGQRRLAIRSVQRTTEDLLLISDALKTKNELGTLPQRLGNGLQLIKDNISRIHRSEGLLSRKKVAMGRVNRYELLRNAFGTSAADDRSEISENVAGEDLYSKFEPRKHKVQSKRRLIAGAIMTGLALVLLCCTTVFVKQYEEDFVLLVAPASSHEIAELHEHDLIAKTKITHASKGMLEVKLGASDCHALHTDEHPQYYVHAQIRQNETMLAKLDDLKLHDLGGAAESSGSTYQKMRSSSSSRHRMFSRRSLLSGAGNAGPGPSVEKMSYLILDKYSQSNGDVYLAVSTNCPENVSIRATVRDIGVVGVGQQWVALVLLLFVFGLIIVEVIHRTLVAFLGAAAVLFILCLEHRFPSVATIIQWMDHETLALLWGMMVIVALLARSGVFEFLSVRLIEMSRCDMWRLTWLLMLFDCFLSAFLDNVTTMLLLAPVIISLCKAIKIDPRPLLIPLALFGNIGGAATMIGDPPNIIVGNALKEYIDFNDFLQIMAPGVILTVPVILAFVRFYYGKEFYAQKIECDIEKMKRDYPIRDMPLLIRSGIVLCFVIVLFFLHPVIHFSPSYAALFGAIAVLLTGPEHE